MVNNEAIVSVVKQICAKNKIAPCKKALQKIVFLIEARGIDLGCDYGIHFYGPYSSDLDFAVRELSNDGILEIEYTEAGHNISVKDETGVDAYNNVDVATIVNEFLADSPSYLELLTTALYVYINSSKQQSAIIEGVKKIKGAKYSNAQITEAISRLEKTGYVA